MRGVGGEQWGRRWRGHGDNGCLLELRVDLVDFVLRERRFGTEALCLNGVLYMVAVVYS